MAKLDRLVKARRPTKKAKPYLCDQCSAPATETIWFRLHNTTQFVSTKRCDACPYEVPPWVLDLRRPPRRPSKR
jgi:hypothetical protein